MNFKDAYTHFLDGTASAEEVEYVREEMNRVREIDEILHRTPENDIFNEVEDETVEKARKQFNFKNTVRIIIVVFVVLVFLAVAICGYIFGTAIPAARKNSDISRDQALVIAEDYLTEFLGKDAHGFIVHDIDRHLISDDGLKNAMYCYEIELRDETTEYEITVNAASGYATITDIDYHN